MPRDLPTDGADKIPPRPRLSMGTIFALRFHTDTTSDAAFTRRGFIHLLICATIPLPDIPSASSHDNETHQSAHILHAPRCAPAAARPRPAVRAPTIDYSPAPRHYSSGKGCCVIQRLLPTERTCLMMPLLLFLMSDYCCRGLPFSPRYFTPTPLPYSTRHAARHLSRFQPMPPLMR